MINTGTEDDDHLPLSERLKHQKGKKRASALGAYQGGGECDFASRSPKVAKGALALMDRVDKLKEKTGAYSSQFISDGSQSRFDSVWPVVDGLTPPSLTLPMETLEEECSSDIVHANLTRLQRSLKKTPLDIDMIVKQIKFLSGMAKVIYAATTRLSGEAIVTPTNVGSTLGWIVF